MKNFIKNGWFKIILIVIIGVVLYITITKEKQNRQITFLPVPIISSGEIRCTLSETGGIYDKNNSIEPQSIIELQNLKKDNDPIKFSFKIIENEATILISDSGGVSETKGLVITNNEDKIHIINMWGMDQDNVQAFTIYPKTGFFNWVRMGDMILLYNALGYGHGRCL